MEEEWIHSRRYQCQARVRLRPWPTGQVVFSSARQRINGTCSRTQSESRARGKTCRTWREKFSRTCFHQVHGYQQVTTSGWVWLRLRRSLTSCLGMDLRNLADAIWLHILIGIWFSLLLIYGWDHPWKYSSNSSSGFNSLYRQSNIDVSGESGGPIVGL